MEDMKQCNKDFYYFINDTHICGTRKELIEKLSYWRDTVDKNNKYMLDIENYFINLLKQEDNMYELLMK